MNAGSYLYFADGIRRIDYMMVAQKEFTKFKDKQKLDKFLSEVEAKGIDFEIDNSVSQYSYIKIHVPFPVLLQEAEDSNLQMPVSEETSFDKDKDSLWSKIYCCIKKPFVLKLPTTVTDFYMVPFRKMNLKNYIDHDKPNTFFTAQQRSKMCHDILDRLVFGKVKKAQVGIERLAAKGVIEAAFPLHEGMVNRSSGAELTPRQILYDYWAHPSNFWKRQPLDHVNEYFGTQIAFYFAWLGFYTQMLLPSAVIGIFVFIYGVSTFKHSKAIEFVCNEAGNESLFCPTCKDCMPRPISSNCMYAYFSHVSDNIATVLYAVFIAIWSVTVQELWRRKSKYYEYHWDVFDITSEEEKPRPQYVALATSTRVNPVTDQEEPYFPKYVRIIRSISSLFIVTTMLGVVIIFVVAIIFYRIIIMGFIMNHSGNYKNQAGTVSSSSGAFLNLIVIMLLSSFYEKIAVFLNNWEMHRTYEEYQNSLTLKSFIFQFVNYYSSLFYIAFVKGKFVGPPNTNELEVCAGSCLSELFQQLAVIMVGKQIISNISECVVPFLKYRIKKCFQKSQDGYEKMRGEEENFSLPAFDGLFYEYLEMVLQFGFVTVFVIAFPLAPLFAYLNNIAEIRVDAYKLVASVRRPVGQLTKGIGIWETILSTITKLAVIGNAFLIAFTSEFIERTVYFFQNDYSTDGYYKSTLRETEILYDNKNISCYYRSNPIYLTLLSSPEESRKETNAWIIMFYKITFVVIFEHLVFFGQSLMEFLIPDVPESVDVKIKRKKYLARQLLSSAGANFQKASVSSDLE